MTIRKNKVAPTQRKSFAYVRVSTDDQAREGVSLDAQAARIASYCVAMGWDEPEAVRDAGESAKSLQRPGIDAVLASIRRGEVERLIVAKLDRLTRSVRDLSDLIDLCAKHGVALVSVAETLDTGSAAGRMVVSMLGVVAEWERSACGERTASALAHKRSQGNAYGSTPFGYRRDGDKLAPVPEEQTALAEALRMDKAGASFRAIGAMFTARGVMPHRGKAWYASSVRAVLRSRIVTESTAA